MVCTVIAFRFVCTERVHRSHQHSVKQTTCCVATPPYAHITHLVSGLYKDCYQKTTCKHHLSSCPWSSHMSLVQVYSTGGTAPVHDLSRTMLGFLFAWFSPTWEEVAVLWTGGFFFFYEYDSSIDCEGSTTMELIQRKVLHKPRKTKNSSSDKEQIVRYSRQKL